MLVETNIYNSSPKQTSYRSTLGTNQKDNVLMAGTNYKTFGDLTGTHRGADRH